MRILRHNLSTSSLLIVFLGLLAIGCRKENFNLDPKFSLEFSSDTVIFDTVFTTIGSVTMPLKVFNKGRLPVKISSITLAGGQKSNFRMNVDGHASDDVQDLEIEGGDSIYVLVEVTVDPNNINNPLIITDSIVFITNGNLQDVKLVAWGQDAYFHYPDKFSPNLPPYSLVGGDWFNDKPHVVYGYAVVDEDSVLTIHPGARIHFHSKSVLWVYDGGSLRINGTEADPVIIQGDRLEQDYKDVPGQWGRIWLSAGSIDNVVENAIIRNGSIGLHVDTLGNSSNPTLTLRNTLIENMSIAGLYAQGATIDAYNSVFTNCGQYSVALALGGRYRFYHCTLGNYWTYGVRQTPVLALNNYYKDVNNNIQIRDLDLAYFGNCIIHGSNAEEIALDSSSFGGTFNFRFENCILKTERSISGSSRYVSCLKNPTSSLFVDRSKNNLHLADNSPAIDFGAVSAGGGLNFDLEGNARVYGPAPDAGAYEWVPVPKIGR